ncbi:LysM peptidoglycan-binding domain-containing protein [Loktanella agnita]|uniref:LysM peptidoglycan-binding domain-containing protein n=1 Tax=Loktanella agnita TaxID=287097 RepID=UPI0039867318
MSDETQTKTGLAVLGGAAALALAVGIALFLTAPDTANLPADDEQPASLAVDIQAPELPTPSTDILPAPSFDTFRVEPDGRMVVAGRASPNQVIAIMLAGDVLERVTAESNGSFVAFPSAGPSDLPRRLYLLADPEGNAVQSETSYIVAPIAPPQVASADLPDTGPVTPELPDAGLTTTLPDDPRVIADGALDAATARAVPESDTAAATLPTEPAAPTVLQADAEGIRVVQSAPQLNAPAVPENVALDAITYDPEGEVQLSGRATSDGDVQVYLDNQPLVTSGISDQGEFRIDLPEIDTGVYTLRIDELDAEGDVVSRIETPFKREEPAEVAAVMANETAQPGFEVGVRTVQPGATLWAIAEENLGDGIFYVEVYAANADLIRDPDLIYPGQIFRIPEINQ